MINVRVEDVNFDQGTQMGVVLLTDLEGKRILPIWVGLFEAQAILFKLKQMHFPRPLTYDLMKNLVEQLKGKVDFVLISNVTENTFYAEIHLHCDGEEVVLDSRPSDAVALALRVNAGIYVSEEVFSEHSWVKEKFVEYQKSEFYRRVIEKSTDEDIGKA